MTLIRLNAGVHWNDAFSVFATNPPSIRTNTRTFSESTHVRSVFSDSFIVLFFFLLFLSFLIQRITNRKGRFGRIIVALSVLTSNRNASTIRCIAYKCIEICSEDVIHTSKLRHSAR